MGEATAQLVGVNRAALNRSMKQPVFVRAVHSAEANAVEDPARMLAWLGRTAVATLAISPPLVGGHRERHTGMMRQGTFGNAFAAEPQMTGWHALADQGGRHLHGLTAHLCGEQEGPARGMPKGALGLGEISLVFHTS
jgi:hypothetical protein